MTYAVPYTRIPGILVPAVPPAGTAELLALQFQLSQSQYWPQAILADAHKVQISALLTHAAQQIPFYAERLSATDWRPGALIDHDQFRQIPILQRSDAMRLGENLRAREIPEGHGEVTSSATSGSTGRSLRFWTTEVFQRLQYASYLRLYLWHRWDFHQNLAAIRVDRGGIAPPPDGRTFPDWGDWLAEIYPTGKYHLLSARSDIGPQLDWLEARRPAYLQTYPSILSALLDRVESQDRDISYLQGIGTLAELVPPELRERVRNVIGRPLVDVYSSHEMGHLAIQCPEAEHYHVQAENVVLEVLDEAGEPCRPGQIGRVVVTTLHNFAAPLIRYEIGDYAELGEPCDCGRTLPTLSRIMGRSRNMLKKPNGETVWPHFGTAALHRCAPIRQFQVVQKSLETIELRLVVPEPLSAQVEARLKTILVENLEFPFEIEIRYFDEIDRSGGGKYEDFMSEV